MKKFFFYSLIIILLAGCNSSIDTNTTFTLQAPNTATEETSDSESLPSYSFNEQKTICTVNEAIESYSGHISVEVKYDVDTQTNSIIALNEIKNITDLDNHYNRIVNDPTIIRSHISLSGETAEFCIKFYAYTDDYPFSQEQEEYFKFNLQ